MIHFMWGIVLSENMSKSWKASDFLTLTHFQALLSTLIRQTNEPVNLYGPHDQSLLCSQQKFLARSHQTSAESEVDLPTENLDSSDRSDPPPPDSIEPKPPDIPIALEKIPLKDHIENDISAASLNVIVVGLMAGAIFAIVIIFLQCASRLSNFPLPKPPLLLINISIPQGCEISPMSSIFSPLQLASHITQRYMIYKTDARS